MLCGHLCFWIVVVGWVGFQRIGSLGIIKHNCRQASCSIDSKYIREGPEFVWPNLKLFTLKPYCKARFLQSCNNLFILKSRGSYARFAWCSSNLTKAGVCTNHMMCNVDRCVCVVNLNHKSIGSLPSELSKPGGCSSLAWLLPSLQIRSSLFFSFSSNDVFLMIR